MPYRGSRGRLGPFGALLAVITGRDGPDRLETEDHHRRYRTNAEAAVLAKVESLATPCIR
jgi:hypothetical protein